MVRPRPSAVSPRLFLRPPPHRSRRSLPLLLLASFAVILLIPIVVSFLSASRLIRIQNDGVGAGSGAGGGSAVGVGVGVGVPPPPPRKRPRGAVPPADVGDAGRYVSCGGHRASSCDLCHQGRGASYCNGDCTWDGSACVDRPKPPGEHPEYASLIKLYPFQPVTTERGAYVNVILVRSPFRDEEREMALYERYRDEILFLGISSYESYPLSSPNPYSGNFPNDKYVGLFPGFLHMMRNPDDVFPSHVKTILMSQSDFALPHVTDSEAESIRRHKVYDFTFSGSDQDVYKDCVGWSSFAKNWTFVKQALEVMCSPEFDLRGVLVATRDKSNRTGCTIPSVCDGKIIQTPFLDQGDFHGYIKRSRFVFVPQVYDASPRVTTQALALNVPLLMNRNIQGGWKYINDHTGEFFHDMSDFKSSLRRILNGLDGYEPRRWVESNYGDERSGARLREFVVENFSDRVELPAGTRLLLPTGA